MKYSVEYKSVLVLLSTYNGEKYLVDLLESLFVQKGVDVFILVRDDGSLDSTLKILNDYSSKLINMTVLAEDNIGCALSFNRLMIYALTMTRKFEYYAFCDQDDVWDDDKLSCALNNLEKNSGKSLRLYTSAYRVVDENLNFQYTRNLTYWHSLGEALIRINTLGCTQVFSKGLLEEAIKISGIQESNSKGMPNHDGWMYLTAITLNAHIYHDSVPHINYRQHDSNVVGAFSDGLVYRFKRILASKNIKSRISNILLNTFDNLDIESEELLALNSTYKNSVSTKLKLIFSKEMMTNSITVNLAYRMLIIFNRF
jgi:glycosyltransferase involved in cell wall biosynthesis